MIATSADGNLNLLLERYILSADTPIILTIMIFCKILKLPIDKY